MTLKGTADEFFKLGNKENFRTLMRDSLPEYYATTISTNLAEVSEAIQMCLPLSSSEVDGKQTSTVVVQVPNLDGGLGTFIVARVEEYDKVTFYLKHSGETQKFATLTDLAQNLQALALKEVGLEGSGVEFNSEILKTIRIIATPFIGDAVVSDDGERSSITLAPRVFSMGFYFVKQGGQLAVYTTPPRVEILEDLSFVGIVFQANENELENFSPEELNVIKSARFNLGVKFAQFLQDIPDGVVITTGVDGVVSNGGRNSKDGQCELNPIVLCMEVNTRCTAIQGAINMFYVVIDEAQIIDNRIKEVLADGHIPLFNDGYIMYQKTIPVPHGTSLESIADYVKEKLSEFPFPVVLFNPKEVVRNYNEPALYFQFLTPVTDSEPPKIPVVFFIPEGYLHEVTSVF